MVLSQVVSTSQVDYQIAQLFIIIIIIIITIIIIIIIIIIEDKLIYYFTCNFKLIYALKHLFAQQINTYTDIHPQTTRKTYITNCIHMYSCKRLKVI